MKPRKLTVITVVLLMFSFTLVLSGCNSSETSEPSIAITSGMKNKQLTSKKTTIHGTAKNATYVTTSNGEIFFDRTKVHNGKWSLTVNNIGGEKHVYLVATKKYVTTGSDFSKNKYPAYVKLDFSKALQAEGSSELAAFSSKASSRSAASSSKEADKSSQNANSKAESNSKSESSNSKAFNIADYQTGITYDQLARTPNDYKKKNVTFTGKVIQVIEGDSETDLRVAINGDSDNIVLVGFDPSIMNGSRVLEEDKITFYGVSLGTTTYKSTLGGKITVPLVAAVKIEDSGKAPDDYGYTN
jgi:hypothetical protein